MRAKEFIVETAMMDLSPQTIHKLADRKGVKWDNEPSFLQLTKRLTGKEHLDDLDHSGLNKVKRHLDGLQGVAEGSLGTVLPWPEVVNKVSGAMKAMGWKGTRKADGTFMFSTRGQETDDQYYIVIIDNAGEGFFTYALGTIEEGDPRIGEQESLPNTEASVSELMNAIRDGFGLSEQGVAEGQDDKAQAYRAHLIKTLPQIMKLFANIGKGWIPSKEQMLSAVDTAYIVMKHTGDVKQAGKVLMDELNTLYRMSQGKQGVAEGLAENLNVDVPNEEWLQSAIDDAIQNSPDRNGLPYMGKTTATARNVEIPIRILKRIPGMRREQSNVRHRDLAAIRKIMSTTGKLPLHTHTQEEYKPFINVAYDGSAWVNEGNHRIMAAYELGWPSLPVEISYFDGGERIESGTMYPSKIGLA
jgi:hypothetical protein